MAAFLFTIEGDRITGIDIVTEPQVEVFDSSTQRLIKSPCIEDFVGCGWDGDVRSDRWPPARLRSRGP